MNGLFDDPTAVAISSFHGEHRWLSNFWPCRVEFEGVVYPSVENAYQAAKFSPVERSVFVLCTSGQAKRLGRTMAMRPDWDSVKVDVMRAALAQKFAPGTDLAAQLLATGNVDLIEGNTWGDTFWGVSSGKGHNHLGRLLMDRRAQLQQLLAAPAPAARKGPQP